MQYKNGASSGGSRITTYGTRATLYTSALTGLSEMKYEAKMRNAKETYLVVRLLRIGIFNEVIHSENPLEGHLVDAVD